MAMLGDATIFWQFLLASLRSGQFWGGFGATKHGSLHFARFQATFVFLAKLGQTYLGLRADTEAAQG